MSCLIINLLQLTTFRLIHVTVNIQMSSCGSNAGMETFALLVNDILNSAPAHVSVGCCVKSFTFYPILHCPVLYCTLLNNTSFCSQLCWDHSWSATTNLAWWINGGRLHSALVHGVSVTSDQDRGVWHCYRGLGENGGLVVGLLGWMSTPPQESHFLQCTHTHTHTHTHFSLPMPCLWSVLHYYAALLPRRGPHNASHSVCPSVCLSVPLSLPSVTSRHLANYNDIHVLFGTRWGPHIVRPSRPHRFLWFSQLFA